MNKALDRDHIDPVPAPAPPGDQNAWYRPNVRVQEEVFPGVVVTIANAGDSFTYSVREPILAPADRGQYETIAETVTVDRRPLTRSGVQEMLATSGLEAGGILDSNSKPTPDCTLDAWRRIRYYLLRDCRCLGTVTPLALDDNIDVVDREGDRLVVHTDWLAPIKTGFPADHEFAERVVSERIATYTVEFCGYSIPVVIYQEHVVGGDAFSTHYAVREPPLRPGDQEAIEACKEELWRAGTDQVIEDRTQFIRERSHQIFAHLNDGGFEPTESASYHDDSDSGIQSLYAKIQSLWSPAVDASETTTAGSHIEDLTYYVLRDFVGEGPLSIPIRDPNLEDIEANAVGERIKVVPRSTRSHAGRMPTNLAFENETAFVNVVNALASRDGVELSAATPSAKVNVTPTDIDDVTMRAAVALPTISESGPHVSIRKQAKRAMTPVELIEGGSISRELVTMLWMLYEHTGVVIVSGPTGVGKTTLMNAHMPFINFEDRPISIDEGSREVRVPHETGVSLSTHGTGESGMTMADLMTECNYLNPDVEIIAEINTPESFQTLASTLNTGHGVVGTTHAEDIETFVHRLVNQGISPALVRTIDLVVFPRHVNGERYVGEAIEFVEDSTNLGGETGTVEVEGEQIHWNRVAASDPGGTFHFAYSHPRLHGEQDVKEPFDSDAGSLDVSAFDDERPDRSVGVGADEPGPACDMRLFHRLARTTDRSLGAVEAEFHRKYRYVCYLVQENVTDVDTLFDFLSDLRTNEAATVQRLGSRQQSRGRGQ